MHGYEALGLLGDVDGLNRSTGSSPNGRSGISCIVNQNNGKLLSSTNIALGQMIRPTWMVIGNAPHDQPLDRPRQ